MDLKDICRICLLPSKFMLSIFSSIPVPNSPGSKIQIVDLLNIFTNISVSPAGELPNNICTDCLDKVQESYNFKLKYEKRESNLRNLKDNGNSQNQFINSPKEHDSEHRKAEKTKASRTSNNHQLNQTGLPEIFRNSITNPEMCLQQHIKQEAEIEISMEDGPVNKVDVDEEQMKSDAQCSVFVVINEDDKVITFDDGNNAKDGYRNHNVPKNRIKKIQVRKRGREVKGEWPDEKISKLISLVEQRPFLWDASLPNYRVSKPQLWDEVATELGGNEIGSYCKSKWQGLRVQFKTNLALVQKGKCTNGTKESVRVHWRFFKAMQFIETSDIKNVTESTTTINLDEESTSDTQTDMSIGEPSSSGVSKRRKRTTFRPIQTPPEVQTLQSETIKDVADAAIQMMCRNDEHSAFAYHIGAELHRLPSDAAQILKCRLTRTLLDFWEERTQPQLNSTAQNPQVATGSIQHMDDRRSELDPKLTKTLFAKK